MHREVTALEVRGELQNAYRFGKHVDLTDCHISGELSVVEADICGVDFTGSVFLDPVDFTGSTFQGLSWFKEVHFASAANFTRVCFFNDARFDRANFGRTALYDGSDFRGVACFDRIQADDTISLRGAVAYGNLSLADSQINNLFELDGATLMGGIWMPGCNAQSTLALDSCLVQGRIESDGTPPAGSAT